MPITDKLYGSGTSIDFIGFKILMDLMPGLYNVRSPMPTGEDICNVPYSRLSDRLGKSSFKEIKNIAEKTGLTTYDAAYLFVAEENNSLLATLDEKMRKVAEEVGVDVFADS